MMQNALVDNWAGWTGPLGGFLRFVRQLFF